MRKGLLIALLALGVATTAAAGGLQKRSQKPKYQAKADTSANIKSDEFNSVTSFDRMMTEMQKQSQSFMNNAMAMLDDMPMQNFNFPEKEDSLLKRMGRNEFVDSLGNCRFHKRRGMVGACPKMHGKQLRMRTDSLGNSESIVVLSDGKKTTIIKNGKDTTIVDGPMDNIMDDFGFNMDMPTMHHSMPMFNFRGFDDNDSSTMPGHTLREGFVSEAPSVEEMSMLAKKGIISSKESNVGLKVEGLNLFHNSRSNTYSVIFSLKGVKQCELQVVDSDGTALEKSTIIGNDDRFKRTVKIVPNQDFVYVVVSNNGKVSVNKFWL